MATYQTLLLTSLSLLGFYAVWGVMYLNSALPLLLTSALAGTHPQPSRPLVASYTGFLPLDLPLRILVLFFDSLLATGPDPAPYLILLELVSTLLVINTMVLAESRRRHASSWSPALWQYAWNCAGVAVFLPLWVLGYVAAEGGAGAKPIPAAEARAVPYTAAWGLVLMLPLMAPTVLGAGPEVVQWGVVGFFVTPALFVWFHRAVVARGKVGGKGRAAPVRLAYGLVGAVGAAVHIGTVCYAVWGKGGGWERVYWPRQGALPAGGVLTEGAMLFIQYDYVLMSLVIGILGFHVLCLEPVGSAESRTRGGQFLFFVVVSALLGPGAGLAYVMAKKERRLESVQRAER
ncbi:hypothetical protein B0T25DRAFT_574392 [Lasiosphaeria hispida]|uniref:Uncharacterized protein n=1 Tax=Lasiosphaeria hispida TaxID=260671 RepID=A0AAJ0M8S2_9PEZI|nr:hypothetical protein B0T25DRAFT_574392 [Lasiosphaeria hispida]